MNKDNDWRKEVDRTHDCLHMIELASQEFGQHGNYVPAFWHLVNATRFLTKDEEMPYTIRYTASEIRKKFKDSEMLIRLCRSKGSEGIIYKCDDYWVYINISSIMIDIANGPDQKTFVKTAKDLHNAYMTIYNKYQPWINKNWAKRNRMGGV